MSLFKRKRSHKAPSSDMIYAPQSPEHYRINYRFIPSTQTYEVNDLERAFFEELSKQFGQMGLFKSISMDRMSNGALSVYYGSYPLGKIRLQKRNHWMQVLTVKRGCYDSYSVEGSLGDFIPHISRWAQYAKHLELNELDFYNF